MQGMCKDFYQLRVKTMPAPLIKTGQWLHFHHFNECLRSANFWRLVSRMQRSFFEHFFSVVVFVVNGSSKNFNQSQLFIHDKFSVLCTSHSSVRLGICGRILDSRIRKIESSLTEWLQFRQLAFKLFEFKICVLWWTQSWAFCDHETLLCVHQRTQILNSNIYDLIWVCYVDRNYVWFRHLFSTKFFDENLCDILENAM